MISILGIPYDEKSSFEKGSAKAPEIIMKYFRSDGHQSLGENGIDTRSSLIVDEGNAQIKEYFDISSECEKILKKGHRILSLGGDHSISYPILKAYSAHYSNLNIIVIDAHPDLYDSYQDDPYNHACPFARVMEDGISDNLIQLGIRSSNHHQEEQAEKFGVKMMKMKDFKDWSLPKLLGPIYLSIDLDGLDPAYAPGVSHQEPGGLSTRQVIDIIQSIRQPIVGADIVEYNPRFDVQNRTAYLAAKLMKELLSKMLEL